MKKEKQKIYLDHAATTKVDPEVFKKMMPYFQEEFGNPSSLHSYGQSSLKAVDNARGEIRTFFNARKTSEIIFTSGATEADNIAIQGLASSSKNFKGKHIITTKIEHPAVLDTFKALAKKGFDVSYLDISPDGVVDIENLKKAIKDATFLISVMYVNNEIGSIQPIREIGKYLKKLNKERDEKKLNRIYFHTDAAQALNYLDCNVLRLHVDMLSCSGHKIYGPKGIGVLYVKDGTPIKKISYGGEHEYELRPGTLNVPGIVGMAAAINKISLKSLINDKITKLSSKLEAGITNKIPKTKVLGDPTKKIPSIININFKKVEGESIMLSLDFEGIACSTGSACASGSLEPSHVIMSLGLKPEDSHGSIRFSLGKDTTEEEIDRVIKVLPPIINRLRVMSPIK